MASAGDVHNRRGNRSRATTWSGSAPTWACWPGWRSRRGYEIRVDLSGVVQQTLLEAHQALKEQPARERTGQATATWLRSILSHNLADALRKLVAGKRDVRREWSLDAALDQSASRLEHWLAVEQSSPSQRAIRQEELLRMAEILAELPEAQRRAIELHHLRGMPLAEIADELGSTKAAVAGLLHRGLKTLRTRLESSSSL